MTSTEIDELTEGEILRQASQFNEQLTAAYQWGISQAADLRSKAELLSELEQNDVEVDIDELDCVPAEPARLEELALVCENVSRRMYNGDKQMVHNANV